MKTDSEIIESLIAGGIIGATIGAILSEKKEEGSVIGAMIGATILGTYKANEKAKQSQMTMLMVENGNLIETEKNGSRRLLRNIKQPDIKLQNHFFLDKHE